MTFELFAPEPAIERLEIPGGEVCFARQIDLPQPADDLLRELIDHTLWRHETVTIHGTSAGLK